MKTLDVIFQEEVKRQQDINGVTVTPEIQAKLNEVKKTFVSLFPDKVEEKEEVDLVIPAIQGVFAETKDGGSGAPAVVQSSGAKKANLPKKIDANEILKDAPKSDLEAVEKVLDGMCPPEDRAVNSRQSELLKLIVAKNPNGDWINEGTTGTMDDKEIAKIKEKMADAYNDEEKQKAQQIIEKASRGEAFEIKRTTKPSTIIGIEMRLSTEGNPRIFTMNDAANELFTKTYGGFYDKKNEAGVALRYMTKTDSQNGIEKEETFMKAVISGKANLIDKKAWETTHELVAMKDEEQKLPITECFEVVAKNKDGSPKKNKKDVVVRRKVYPRVSFGQTPEWKLKPRFAEAGFTESKAFGSGSVVKFESQEDINAAVANMKSMLIRMQQGHVDKSFEEFIEKNAPSGGATPDLA